MWISRKCGLSFVAMAALLGAAADVRAATDSWTGGGGANDNWSFSSNWSGGVPGSSDTAQFTNTDVNNNNVVDSTRSIAGMIYANSTGQHITDLSSNTLTNTGDLNLAVDINATSSATIRNGTYLIGSSSTRTNWIVGGRPTVPSNNNGTMTLSNLGVTGFLNQLAIGYNPIFNNQTTNTGTLNVTNNSVVNLDTTNLQVGIGFNATGSVVVNSGSSFNVTASLIDLGGGSNMAGFTTGNVTGTLDLSAAAASTLSATTAYVGYPLNGTSLGTGNLRLGGSSLTVTTLTAGNGTIASTSGSTLQIQSGGSMNVAYGRTNASSLAGTVSATIGTGATLNFGSGTSNRANLNIGVIASGDQAGSPTGTLTVNGTMSGFIDNLNVGVHSQFNDQSWFPTGTLDTRNGTLSNLTINTLTLGNNFNAKGTAMFGAGTMAIGTATVGAPNTISGFSTKVAKGYVSLNGTVAQISNSLTIADKGEIDTSVLGTSSGFDITNSSTSAFAINNSLVASNGGLQITFTQNPNGLLATAATANNIFYGFKWSGDHVTALQALQSGGKLSWDSTTFLTGSFNNAVSIFYDPAVGTGLHTGATYIGFYTAPEPSAVAMLVGGACGAISMRRRSSQAKR